MGWLAGWSNRKTVTITGQSGAGTNYQVKLSIGDASGGDFHLENHCTSFPNDIRVTDNDQTTPLDYWTEDLTVDPISMWVEVADSLDSNADVCVYYRKSGESSASSIRNTFLVGDDFSDGDYTTNPTWTVISGTTWDASPFYLHNNDANVHSKISTPSTTVNAHWRAKVKVDSLVTWGGVGFEPIHVNGGGDGYYLRILNNGDLNLIREDNGAQTAIKTVPWTPDTNWHILELTRDSDSLWTIWFDGVNKGTVTDSTYTTSTLFVARHYGGNATKSGSIDEIFISKYQTTEPAYLSASGEESAPTGAIMNQFQKANLGADLYDGGLIT